MRRIAFFLILPLVSATLYAQSPAASPSPTATPAPAYTAAPQAPQPPMTTGTSARSMAAKVTFSEVNVDGPYIAMTFDDGPSGPNTPRLLDLAARKHIKLTFFLIGQNAQRYPQLVQRELAEGHEVGNHTWTHPVLSKMSDAAVRSEIQKTQDVIVSETGYKPTLMRPPYGALTPAQRLWVAREFGVKIILWDVDPLDWKRPGSSVVAQRIIAATHPGSIILSHDIHSGTVDAMPEVFDTLLAKGYKFVTVSELLAMDKGPRTKKGATKASPSAAPATASAIPASTP